MAKKKRRRRTGGRVIDPTKNVMALVAGQVKRSDDLAAANEKLAEAKEKRQDDLRAVEAEHVREMARLRAQFDEALREKETQRIDAIRAVDVAAVQRAAEVSAVQATTLAAQVQTSAEAMRAQVAAAAQAAAVALAAALEPIQKSIDDLRKTQYEQQGQKAAQVETRVTRAEDRGSNQWAIGIVIGIMLSVVTVVLHFIR